MGVRFAQVVGTGRRRKWEGEERKRKEIKNNQAANLLPRVTAL